jgi:hypothetical protein
MSFVYVISDDPLDTRHPVDGVENVKIGFTSDSNISNRIRQLQTGNPRSLRIIEIHEFKNDEMARQIESLCHWNLADQRLCGEWFKYSGKTIEVLSAIAGLSNHYPLNRFERYLEKYPHSGVMDYVC